MGRDIRSTLQVLFYDLQQEYGLMKKIHINENGYGLKTNMPTLKPFTIFRLGVGIPNEQFELLHTCKRDLLRI